MSVSNKVVVKNMLWRYAERFCAQTVSFLVTLVLARLLTPADYGTVSLIMVIVNIFDVFSTRGFCQSLIQKQDIDDVDYSTIFYTNIVINVLFYIFLYNMAPIMSRFFENKQLTLLLRILSIRILITGVNSVQQAYVQRNMQYRKFFYSTSISTLISAVVGVIMAFMGYGAWALVVQSLLNTLGDTLILFFTIEWKPKLLYSFSRLKAMMSFGLQMLLVGLMESVYDQIRSLIIGKVYTSSDLAYYDKGKTLPHMVVANIQVAAGNVFFSALSREENNEQVKMRVREYFRPMFFLMCPILVGMAVVSMPLIHILYTDKWIGAVPFLIIYCFSYLTWVPQMVFFQGLNSRGLGDKTLFIQILYRIVGLGLLVATIHLGPIYIALGVLGADVFAVILVYFVFRRVFNYRLSELIEDIGGTLVATIIMAIVVYWCGTLVSPLIVGFILQVIVGIAVYGLLSIVFYKEAFSQLKHLVQNGRRDT